MEKDRNVRLIFGDDEYRIRQAVDELLSRWAPPDQRAFGLEIVDGAQEIRDDVVRALDECREALLTPAFLGSIKTVWLRDASFLGKIQTMAAANVKEALGHLADWIADAVGDSGSPRLLITASGVDKRTTFYLACKKAKVLEEFGVPQRGKQADRYAHEQLGTLLRQAGLRAAAPVMQSLVERVGVDTRQLANEIEKLKLYLGDQKVVGLEDVHNLVPPSRQSIAWEFTDAIGRKDLPASLLVLKRLFFQKESPVRLLGMLESFVRDLILYRHAAERRWIRKADPRGMSLAWNALPPEVEAVLGECMERDPRSANPYRMAILAKTAGTFTMDQLLCWRGLIVETYRRMFSGNIPSETILELLLLKMLGTAAGLGERAAVRSGDYQRRTQE